MQHAVAAYTDDASQSVPITEDEYRSVVASRAPLLEALLIEERLEMVLGNYEDFESEILGREGQVLQSRIVGSIRA
jgi:hypothetical protein